MKTYITARPGFNVLTIAAPSLQCADVVNLGAGPAVVTAVTINYPFLPHVQIATTRGEYKLNSSTRLLVMRQEGIQ